VGQFSLFDQVVNVPLGQKGGVATDVPVVLESERAHAGLGSINGDLNHVLRAIHEVRKCMNVAVDGSFEKLVLDSRIDLEHFRVVLEHLVEIILGVELADPLHGKHPAHEKLSGRLCISRKIAHDRLLV
jgi:hypothetical protein